MKYIQIPYEEWTYLLSKVNFKKSCMDARAISAMNEVKVIEIAESVTEKE